MLTVCQNGFVSVLILYISTRISNIHSYAVFVSLQPYAQIWRQDSNLSEVPYTLSERNETSRVNNDGN